MATAKSQVALPKKQMPKESLTDVQHIKLNMQFDFQKKQTIVKEDITLRLLKSSNYVSLDAAMLDIKIVLINNKPANYKYEIKDSSNAIKIFLEKEYSISENINFTFTYNTTYINEIDPSNLSGFNGKGLRWSKPTTNDPNKPYEMYSIGEIEGNQYWMVCNENLNDKFTCEMIITVDNSLTGIGTGELISITKNKNNTTTYSYKNDIPTQNHLMSVHVGEYANIQQVYNGTIINNYCYKNEVEDTKATIVRLTDMMLYFENLTGIKYPFKSYSQIFVQDLPNYINNLNSSTITENMVDDDATHKDYFYLWDITEAESLAGKWFGSCLTTSNWKDAWLSKSFAHYIAMMYNEYKNGKDEMLMYQLSFDQGNYFGDWSNNYRKPIVTDYFEDALGYVQDNYSTFRGSCVLHMLRKQIGESNFRNLIKEYVKTFAQKSVTTSDFIAVTNKVTKQDLTWFFNQWVYNIGHPVFEINKNFDEKEIELVLNVKQVQTLDTTTSYTKQQYFKGRAFVKLDNEIKEIFIEAKAENNFRLKVKTEPKVVHFDVEDTWIKEISFTKSSEELLYQLENDKDVMSKSWALNELSGKTNQLDNTFKTKYKNILLNLAEGNDYWRFKQSALFQLRLALTDSISKNVVLDKELKTRIIKLCSTSSSWYKAWVLSFMNATNDTSFANLYLASLQDKSFRVINSAAPALGKTKSPKAFNALKNLVNKPSMKSQSLLCALSGFNNLKDNRSFDIAFDALKDTKRLRWRLPNASIWDYRVIAAQHIANLKMSEKAYPLIFERLQQAIDEDDLNGAFNNLLLTSVMATTQGSKAFELMKEKYKNNKTALDAIAGYEAIFNDNLKK